MNRLITSGLMFGNLIHVASASLVARYNRALKQLTGQQTTLTDFHIDISGYSPEIGEELGDPLYLNHAGVNRQFILLSTEQKTAPLLDATFSTSRDILKTFIETNEAQLFALTAQDAVAGELVNSVYDVSSPARLFDIRKITVEADTTGGTLQQADKLADLVDEFKTRAGAWHDDVLIARMIETAKQTGDILRNPVRLKPMSVQQENYWTSHFGGAYVFQSMDHPAMIAARKDAIGEVPIKYTFGLHERNRIAKFFEYNDLVEPIVKARGIDAAAILRQKMDFIVVDVAQDAGVDLTGATRSDIRKLARAHGSDLPEVWHGLRALADWAEGQGRWPRISSEHPAYFYSLRAADTPDASLVNQLLAELSPMDVRQLFICHKPLFYELYRSWSESKRGFVVDFLVREYQADKAGARAALFGHDAPMQEPEPVRGPWSPRADIIERVGPWGALRRR
ncbi:DUF6638 family protein [Primorskyibacter sp. S187A]|uniref:DUF6638 family protein n=1 Tax=Primorskyibacter sp. S187A TaxID=3415130 RepID=UPI003C7E17E0